MKKMMMLIVIFICCGCSNFNELEDLSIVSGIFIDRISNNYEIGFEILKSEKQQNGSNISSYLVKDKCQIIDICFNNISKKLSKTIYLAHNELIVVNEEMINYGLENIVDYIVRLTDLRTTLNMVITPVSSFSLFSTEYLETITAKQVNNTLKQSYLDNNTFDLFLVNNFLHGQVTFLPIIEKDNNQIVITGITIFNNFKPQTTLNNYDEYLLLINKLKQNTIKIKCQNEYIIFNMINNMVSYKIDQNKIVFNVDLELKITDDKCNYNLRDKNDLQKLINNVDKEYQEHLSNYLKNINLDYLGTKYLSYIKLNRYETIKEFEIIVNSTISKKGLITKSLITGGIND